MDAAVVPGHLVPAEVVGEDEDDVGSGSGGRGQPSEGQHGEAGPQHGHRSLHTHVYTCPWSHVSLVTRVTSHKCSWSQGMLQNTGGGHNWSLHTEENFAPGRKQRLCGLGWSGSCW